ncbi:MAG: grasp-with-spasm system ATP-grasp peptide maturase [Bacteroidetes bacterium]|nr:grasp-with-spasm system ATP-grasp peptide maturase [Bacteroidota bacterium]
MILIISENNDQSTSEVIDWLVPSGAKFLRVNESDGVTIKHIEIADGKFSFKITVNDTEIDSIEISAYWFRRGWINLNSKVDLYPLSDKEIKVQVNNHLTNELESLKHFLYHILETKYHIGSPLTDKNNKLFTLVKAMEFGLCVPKTWVSETSNPLPKNLKLISKGISSVACFHLTDGSIGNYTEEVDKADFKSDHFFPSLFQEKLDKAYELRIFYLNGIFYSACIFSQSDKQTSVDFRKYNIRKPNRVVPFKLPNETEEKLKMLLDFFDHRTASIDMVVTKENEFVFLEINPIGQFGMVSYPCNYYLEKKIAEHLINGKIRS